MSDFYGKVIELAKIEIYDNKSYLHINLFDNQDVIELLWRIDSETAQNIHNIVKYDGKHKYRLALNTLLDTNNNQIMGVITKTYLDQSEKLFFNCSLEYKNALESIHSSSIIELKSLPFIYNRIDSKNTEDLNEILIKTTRNKNKWPKLSVLFILLVAVVGYFNYLLLSMENHQTNAANVETITTKNRLEKEQLVNKTTPVLSSSTTEETIKPLTFEIDRSKEYSLPEGYVALTFDDGPSKYTVEIADILKKYNVGGTFFFIGINANKHSEHVKYVHANGFTIGNHTMNHANLSTHLYSNQENEILLADNVLEELINEEIVLFRPPYANYNEDTEAIIQQKNDKMILWNIDTKDWKTRNADKIYESVEIAKTSGSIILLHESQAVIDALPRIIEHLQNQGLEIVNLD